MLALVAALSLLTAAAAGAATRYAAPGGTGADPCANPAKPCSVRRAADPSATQTTIRAGDVVELAPGVYHANDEAEFGELGSIRPPKGVMVRGEPGKARPIILIEEKTTVGEPSPSARGWKSRIWKFATRPSRASESPSGEGP